MGGARLHIPDALWRALRADRPQRSVADDAFGVTEYRPDAAELLDPDRTPLRRDVLDAVEALVPRLAGRVRWLRDALPPGRGWHVVEPPPGAGEAPGARDVARILRDL